MKAEVFGVSRGGREWQDEQSKHLEKQATRDGLEGNAQVTGCGMGIWLFGNTCLHT